MQLFHFSLSCFSSRFTKLGYASLETKCFNEGYCLYGLAVSLIKTIEALA